MANVFDECTIDLSPCGLKTSVVYAQKPIDGSCDLALVRAGSKNVLASNGTLTSYGNNVPAIEYDSAGAYKGLPIERAATNLMTYSEQFNNAVWTKIDSSVSANATTAPDGTTTADEITLDGAVNNRVDYLTAIPAVEGNTYTYSVWIKGSGTVTIAINTDVGTGGVTENNLTMTSEWVRYTVTHTYTAGASGNVRVHAFIKAAGILQSFYAWGACLETGFDATSYIPTPSNSTVTRVADAYSKTAISALLNNTSREGTIVYAIDRDLQVYASELLSFTAASASTANRLLLRTTVADKIEAVVVNSSSEVVNILSAIDQSGIKRIIFAYKDNDCALYINGTQIGTDALATIPSDLAEVYLGGVSAANNDNHNVYLLKYIPKRITNAEIVTLDTNLAVEIA